MRRFSMIFIAVVTFALFGCAGGSADGGADPISSGLTYYYDEFTDVAIPKEMKPHKKETFITYGTDGVKLGTLLVSGRVDLASLVNAMQGHMLRDGWALRSVFRSSHSILIFEKADRMCSMYVNESMMDTNMLIFVSLRLVDGAMQYNVPASTSMEPLPPSDPPAAFGFASGQSSPAPAAMPVGDGDNVTVYSTEEGFAQ